MKRFDLVFITLAAGVFCTACSKSGEQPVPQQVDAQTQPETPTRTVVYEDWLAHPERLHQMFGASLAFDLGSPESAKYLEMNGAWLAPEHISSETAKRDGLAWAHERDVRWLAGTTATFHFPMLPDPQSEQVTLHFMMRPKVNESANIKFYQNDDPKNAAWTTPKTFKIEPGWKDNVVTVPRDWLNKSGSQLMRLTFPGTFFEAENRVAAKFVRVAIEQNASQAKTGKITPITAPIQPCRLDDQTRDAWMLSNGNSIERYMILPDNAGLTIQAAPSAWLLDEATVRLTAYSDDAEPAVLLEKKVHAGDDWTDWNVDLSDYNNQAVRLALSVEREPNAFDLGDDLPAASICFAKTQVTTRVPEERLAAFETLKSAKRLVVVAVDNLRSDRALDEAYENVAPNLHALKASAIYGTALGDALGNIATTTSLLTGVDVDQHAVNDETTHVRTSLTSIAEALPDWKSYFFTMSNVIEPSKGFAQGFEVARRLNKEEHSSASDAVKTLVETLNASAEKSLFYLHLTTLRLPLRPTDASFNRFAQTGYAGPVNAQAMQNVAVLKDPSPADSLQFAAYYDATLADLDEALGQLTSQLPDDTLLVIVGTHGCSLGESTLGYMQTLGMWEVNVPWIMAYKPLGHSIEVPELVTVANVSTTLRTTLGAQENSETDLQQPHARALVTLGNGLKAAASSKFFYRIRRDGVDALFSYGDGESPLQMEELQGNFITRQALREMILK